MAKYPSVDAYIATLDEPQSTIVRALRELVQNAVPDAVEVVKWAQPVYEKNGPFCYIKAFPRYVNLGFWRGAALHDPHALVRSGGEKMGHVRITAIDEIHGTRLRPLVKEAAALNGRLGDPSRTR
jgi:hypothetical protein